MTRPLDASLAVYEADSATILLVFYQHEADYVIILLHFLQYEADSAANLPLLLSYEADRAAILLHILKYDTDFVGIWDMGPIILPIWRYTPSVTRPLGRVTTGNSASDASIGRVTCDI